MLSSDPRLQITSWQDVDWLPPLATQATQRARIAYGRVEFALSFTADTSLSSSRSAVAPSGMRLSPGSVTPMMIPLGGAVGGYFQTNTAGSVWLINLPDGRSVSTLATWPIA